MLFVGSPSVDLQAACDSERTRPVDIEVATDSRVAIQRLIAASESPTEYTRPDLVLRQCDFELPDGMTVLDAITSSPRLRATPVVVLDPDDTATTWTYRPGGNAHVSTPGTIEEYVDSVRSPGSGSGGHSTRQSPYILIRRTMSMTDSHARETPVVPDSLLDSVSLLSKKWHPALVRCLSATDGQGFSDLERRLDGVSAKVLTDALEELREYEIIERREVSQSPLRVNYTLTERGHEFDAVIESLADWGETYLAEPETEQVVLVADDNRRVNTMHTAWLEDDYTVRTASDGEETLRSLDADVGVVVLDRRMPGLSGGEVLDWIRSQRYDIRVVMVTSEDVDLDVLDMGFDEYLTKPVRRDELQSVVSELFERRAYSTDLQEYLGLQSKLGLLRAQYPDDTLETHELYQRLRSRLDELEASGGPFEEVDAETLERAAVGSLQ